MAGTATTASTLVKSEPGPITTWSAAAMAASTSGAVRRRAAPAPRPRCATSPTPAPGPPPCPLGCLRLEHDRNRGGRQHAAHRPEQAARLVEGLVEVAQGAGQAGDDQVADGVALELAALEAVLEHAGPHRVGVGQRHEAAAQVAGGGDAERLAQAAARTAVVGHRHDGGDVARVAAHRLQRRGQAVPAAQGHDLWGPHRSTAHARRGGARSGGSLGPRCSGRSPRPAPPSGAGRRCSRRRW